jgi:hypothetical protein
MRMTCPRCGNEGTLNIWVPRRTGSQYRYRYSRIVHSHDRICYIGRGDHRPSSLRASEILRRQSICELSGIIRKYGRNERRVPVWELGILVNRLRNGGLDGVCIKKPMRMTCPRCGNEGTLNIWVPRRTGSQYGRIVHSYGRMCYIGRVNKGDGRPSSLRVSEILHRQFNRELSRIIRRYGRNERGVPVWERGVPVWELEFLVGRQRTGALDGVSRRSLGIEKWVWSREAEARYQRAVVELYLAWTRLYEADTDTLGRSSVARVTTAEVSLAMERLPPPIEPRLPGRETRMHPVWQEARKILRSGDFPVS